MHHKAWYAGTCGMNGHGLIIWTTYYGQMCAVADPGISSIGGIFFLMNTKINLNKNITNRLIE
jgi:hypothetical protein